MSFLGCVLFLWAYCQHIGECDGEYEQDIIPREFSWLVGWFMGSIFVVSIVCYVGGVFDVCIGWYMGYRVVFKLGMCC